MENNTGVITKVLNFFSKSNLFKEWYISLPEYTEQGGDKDDLEMSVGVDIWLDVLSNHADKMNIKVSNAPFENCKHLTLRTDLKEQFNFTDGNVYMIEDMAEPMWISDVFKFIFKDAFPSIIYYEVV